jgi:hypothetical protein
MVLCKGTASAPKSQDTLRWLGLGLKSLAEGPCEMGLMQWHHIK